MTYSIMEETQGGGTRSVTGGLPVRTPAPSLSVAVPLGNTLYPPYQLVKPVVPEFVSLTSFSPSSFLRQKTFQPIKTIFKK